MQEQRRCEEAIMPTVRDPARRRAGAADGGCVATNATGREQGGRKRARARPEGAQAEEGGVGLLCRWARSEGRAAAAVGQGGGGGGGGSDHGGDGGGDGGGGGGRDGGRGAAVAERRPCGAARARPGCRPTALVTPHPRPLRFGHPPPTTPSFWSAPPHPIFTTFLRWTVRTQGGCPSLMFCMI